jgi:hypothetical protein
MDVRGIAQDILSPPPARVQPAQALQDAKEAGAQATGGKKQSAAGLTASEHRPNRNPFSLWVAQQLQAHGKEVLDNTISAAKAAMVAQNPNIEKEYSQTSIVPVKAGD